MTGTARGASRMGKPSVLWEVMTYKEPSEGGLLVQLVIHLIPNTHEKGKREKLLLRLTKCELSNISINGQVDLLFEEWQTC